MDAGVGVVAVAPDADVVAGAAGAVPVAGVVATGAGVDEAVVAGVDVAAGAVVVVVVVTPVFAADVAVVRDEGAAGAWARASPIRRSTATRKRRPQVTIRMFPPKQG